MSQEKWKKILEELNNFENKLKETQGLAKNIADELEKRQSLGANYNLPPFPAQRNRILLADDFPPPESLLLAPITRKPRGSTSGK